MVNLPKLVLVPGSGESHSLVDRVRNSLMHDFRLDPELVGIVSTHGQGMGKEKTRRDPLKVGAFGGGGEREIRSGLDLLWNQFANNHVAFVQYSFQPTEELSQIDSLHMEVRGFFRWLKQVPGLPIHRRTLALPYGPYLRSHSVEKYAAQGHIELDALRMIIEDYHNESIDDLMWLDPHSMKGEDLARSFGLDVHSLDPFDSAKNIIWAKLGFGREEEDVAHKVTHQMQPFVNRYNDIKGKYDEVIMVCPDAGAERRVETFVGNCRAKKKDMAYILKRRIRDGEVEIQGFKSFSPIQERHIIEMAKSGKKILYILPDDMVSSGGTVDDIAKYIKDIVREHAPDHVDNVRIESWTTHPLCENIGKFNTRTEIDEFVCLDTVVQNPNNISVPITYLPATHILLASALYKSYYHGVEKLVGPDELLKALRPAV